MWGVCERCAGDGWRVACGGAVVQVGGKAARHETDAVGLVPRVETGRGGAGGQSERTAAKVQA